MLVWDRLGTHVSAVIRLLIAARPWLWVLPLPGYARDLNPAEGVWSQVKRSLANLIAGGLDRLAALVRNRLGSLQYRARVPDTIVAQTGLALGPP